MARGDIAQTYWSAWLTIPSSPLRLREATHPDFYDNMGDMEIKNKNSINNQDVAAIETREVLKDLLSNLVRKSWNVTRFMEGGRRLNRQRKL